MTSMQRRKATFIGRRVTRKETTMRVNWMGLFYTILGIVAGFGLALACLDQGWIQLT